MTDESRLKWQCRRGMRELDILLERFLLTHYAAAGDAQKVAFRQLLQLSDPELAGYLLRGQPHDDGESRDVISKILGDPGP